MLSFVPQRLLLFSSLTHVRKHNPKRVITPTKYKAPVIVGCFLLLVASPSFASDEHSVQAIVQALQSPIPQSAIEKARRTDDLILSTGSDGHHKVYLVTNDDSKAISSLVRRLLKAMGEDDREWVVRVLDPIPQGVNAFVYGGKYIYIYTGLLKYVKSPDELAFVLGHELGHSLLKHAIRREQDITNSLAGLADAIAGLAARNSAQKVGAVTKAIRASYSRTDEQEADAIGVAIARLAGFDPMRGVDFFTRLGRDSDTQQTNARQQLAQMEVDVKRAISLCLQSYAMARNNQSARNQAQVICNDASQKQNNLNQSIDVYNQAHTGNNSLIYDDHPTDQSRVAAVAALTDYLEGRRDLESLEQYQQTYRVMSALVETNSVLLRQVTPRTSPTDNLTSVHTMANKESQEVNRTPAQSISWPSEGDVFKGRGIFNGKGKCFSCHGIDGELSQTSASIDLSQMNPRPSNLRDASQLRYLGIKERSQVIKEGIPNTAMVALSDKLSDEEITEVSSFLPVLASDRLRNQMFSFLSLLQAAESKDDSKLSAVLKDGGDINATIQNKPPALMWSVSYGHAEAVRLLLNHGANANVNDEMGHTPLTIAIAKDHIEIIRLLLDKGADVNRKDRAGLPPLIVAVAKGNLDIARLLLDKGADIESKGPHGGTAILLAAVQGNTEILKLFLDRGADINVQPQTGPKAGDTALALAAAGNHSEAAVLLLNRGADPTVRNSRGETPATIARTKGYTGLAKLLESRSERSMPLSSPSASESEKVNLKPLEITPGIGINDRSERKEPTKTLADQLKELKEALDLKLITEEEYQIKRQRILGN